MEGPGRVSPKPKPNVLIRCTNKRGSCHRLAGYNTQPRKHSPAVHYLTPLTFSSRGAYTQLLPIDGKHLQCPPEPSAPLKSPLNYRGQN